MNKKICQLDENKICNNCNKCLYCDINPDKICDNCCQCIDINDYSEIKITKIITDENEVKKYNKN